jgi:hypothetical protein
LQLLILHIYFGKWVKTKPNYIKWGEKKTKKKFIYKLLIRVPASQHPEIAPQEFEKYVDSHGLMIRRKSVKRRQSILSVYFTANDQKLLDELARQSTLDALEGGSSNSDNSSKKEDVEVNEEEDENNRKRKMILRRSVSLHSMGGLLYIYMYISCWYENSNNM